MGASLRAGNCAASAYVLQLASIASQGLSLALHVKHASSHVARRLAFRWLVKAEEYVPHPELTGLRNHLVADSARLVAAMSRIRLPDITQQVRGV